MNKYEQTMFDTAMLWAGLSSCNKRKVGAIIAKDNRIISVGYNGTIPSDLTTNTKFTNNECEDENGSTKEHVSHAEFNAIMFLVREGISLKGTSLFMTTKPCVTCANLVIHSGIKKVFYRNDDKSGEGVTLLSEVGIELIAVD